MNNKKKRIIIIGISVILFISLITLFINVYMVTSTKSQIVDINEIENIKDIDAIIVLGCKVEDDEPSLMLARRLDMGNNVYNKIHTKLVLSGSRIDDYDELTVMKNYIMQYNIDKNDLYLDFDGHTTYDSIYRAKNVLKAKKIVIITQQYHLYRALYIANQLDIDAVGVASEDISQTFVMIKNVLRESLSRDKNFVKCIFKPESKFSTEILPLTLIED